MSHETCNENISESVKLDVSRAASEMEEVAAVLAPENLPPATKVDYVLNLKDTVEPQPDSYEQLQVEDDVQLDVTMSATAAEPVSVLSCPMKEEFQAVEAAASLDVAGPKEPDIEAALTTTLPQEQLPVSEEAFSPENTSDIAPPEEIPTEVEEISAELSVEVTSIPPVQTHEAVEEVRQQAAVEETVSLDKTPTTDVDAAVEMTIISTPAEQEEQWDLAKVDEDVGVVDEVVEEQAVAIEVGSDVDSVPAGKTEMEIETAVEQPLKQTSVVEEVHPEGVAEPLVTEPTPEEVRPTDVAYDNVVQKVSVAVMGTVETEECAAELSVQQPNSPEESETEGFISLAKEEEKIATMQPLVMEESIPEESVELLVSELSMEETRPPEVAYDQILSKESIASETVQTEECAAELSIQKPSSPEEAEAESFISLPKEEEKVELLQSQSVEESNPEESAGDLVSEPTAEEIHQAEVAYDAGLPKESIEIETVKSEECVADLSLQRSASPETAETELSIPKEDEEATSLELKSPTPEVSASLDVTQPTNVDVTESSGDIQKPAEAKQVEIEAPRPEVAEDVSLTVAKRPTRDESLTIPKHEEEESASLDSRKPEPETADATASLALPKSPAEPDESASLTLRRPEEETEADLALKLKMSEDGMMPRGGAGRGCRRMAVLRCL